MRRDKKNLVPFLLSAILIINSSCDSFVKFKKGESELKLAYVMAPGGTAHMGAEKFKELVNKKTDGQVRVKIYSNGQLGNDRELNEGLVLGSIDMVLTGPSTIGWYAPLYGAVEAPFMFRSYEHLQRVLDNEIGKEIEQTIRKNRGLHFISYWFRGPRYLTTTSRMVRSPGDLEGLKLRVPELPTYIRSWKVFGANPTPIAYSDMFMALKQGVVDGQENPLEVIYTSHLYEAQKYVMETQHLLSFYILEVGDQFYKKFSTKNQRMILEAAEEARKFQNDLMLEYEDNYRKKLTEAGMEFVKVDRQAFEDLALKTLPPYFEQKWAPGLFERIIAVK